MIATKRHSIAYRNLDAAGLPGRVETVDVVRPDAIVLDADIVAVAFDADLAVVVDIAVPHAAAGPDTDARTAVQADLASFDGPSRPFAGVNGALLRGAGELLDREV